MLHIVSCMLSAPCCLLHVVCFTFCCTMPAARRLLHVVRCLLSVACCLLCGVRCSMSSCTISAVRCLLHVVCRTWYVACCRLHVASNALSAARMMSAARRDCCMARLLRVVCCTLSVARFPLHPNVYTLACCICSPARFRCTSSAACDFIVCGCLRRHSLPTPCVAIVHSPRASHHPVTRRRADGLELAGAGQEGEGGGGGSRGATSRGAVPAVPTYGMRAPRVRLRA